MTTHKTCPIDTQIGVNIREHRLKRGWTQTELGERLADPLSAQQISKYEQGQDALAPIRLFDFAQALRIPMMKLFADIPKALGNHLRRVDR